MVLNRLPLSEELSTKEAPVLEPSEMSTGVLACESAVAAIMTHLALLLDEHPRTYDLVVQMTITSDESPVAGNSDQLALIVDKNGRIRPLVRSVIKAAINRFAYKKLERPFADLTEVLQ